MLKIILGKNNVGKFKNIVENIESSDNKAMIIVPSQMRLEMEKRYIELSNKEGILDLDITAFSRILDKYLEEKNIDTDKVISKIDKTIIVRKIINENKDIFDIYDKVKNKKGFWASIDILIDLFRKEGVDINTLNELTLEDKFLEKKIKEIGKIYECYLKCIEKDYIDQISEMEIFSQDLENINKYKGYDIYLYGNNNFSKYELETIKMLLKVANSVTISLVTDVRNLEEALLAGENTIYYVANETFIKLCEIANKYSERSEIVCIEETVPSQKEDIAYLADNLFKEGKREVYKGIENNINLIYTKNSQTEIAYVAKQIEKGIRMGKRYKDFAIYTNNIPRYSNAINKVFTKYKIPYYIDEKESIITNSLVIYITSLIDVAAKGYDTSSMFKLLKTGLTDIPHKDICYLENFCLKYNIMYGKWLKDFKVYDEKKYDTYKFDETRLNEIRIKAVENVKGFKDIFHGKKTAIEIAKGIYNHLIETNVLKNYELQIESLKRNGYYKKSYISAQIQNKVVDILESIVKIYKDENVTFQEFKDTFEYAITDLRISALPASIDEVMICDINKSRIEQKEEIFILGVNENELPKQINEDVILKDAELIRLERETSLKVRNTSLNKIYMQRYNIILAIASCKSKLNLLYSSAEITGRALRPSSIIYVVKKMFLDLKIVEEVTKDFAKEDIEESLFSKSLYTTNCLKAIAKINKGGNSENIEYIAKIYKSYKTDKLKSILGYVRELENINEELLEEVYGNNLNTSVSRLEKFKSCPFSYFMEYTLKLKEREIYEINNADIGSFLHGVLENFSNYVVEKGIKYHETLANNQYENIVKDIVDKMIENDTKLLGEGKQFIALKNRLLKRITNIVRIVAEGFNASYFEQLGVEIEFGNDSIFAPIKIDLGNNKTMYIKGKIDRVDVYKTESEVYARVIDYKSSKRDLSLEDIRNGISLQLITYMSALIKNKKFFDNKRVVPAGMLYFTLAIPKLKEASYEGDLETLKQKIKDRFKMRGIILDDLEILKLMDKNYGTSDSYIVSKSTRKDVTNSLNRDDFIKECEDAEKTLIEIGNEILSGKTELTDRIHGEKSPCKYCKYNDICRKNIKC